MTSRDDDVLDYEDHLEPNEGGSLHDMSPYLSASSNNDQDDTIPDQLVEESSGALPILNGRGRDGSTVDSRLGKSHITPANLTENTGKYSHHEKSALEHDVGFKSIVLDDDLKDWLDFSGWNDVQFRAGYLDHHRALLSVRQQKAAIEAEEARLRQSQNKYGCVRPNNIPQTNGSAIDTVPATKEYSTGNTIPSTSRDLGNGNYDSYQDLTTKHHVTRKEEHLIIPQRLLVDSPFSRNESSNGSVDLDPISNDQVKWRAPTSMDTRQVIPVTRLNNDGVYPRRSGSPTTPVHKDPWPRAKHSVKQGNNHFADRREYRSRRGELFRPIDLGRLGDTRFFVIRSYCIENVKDSMDDGMWASKHDNAKKLVEAFNSCDNVILIFGANQTHEFQGYARMTGVPSADLPRPKWYTKIKWPISQPFTIEWISKRGIEDSQARALKNNLNENLPVTRSRDCQELDNYCGRALIDLLNQEATRD